MTSKARHAFTETASTRKGITFSAFQKNPHWLTVNKKRAISLVVGIFAALAAIRVLLEAVFVLQDYRTTGQESLRQIALEESILLILASVLLFEAYRLVRYFAKRSH